MRFFYEKLRIWVSTESFLISSDFEYSNFLVASLSLKISGVNKLRGRRNFDEGFTRNAPL